MFDEPPVDDEPPTLLIALVPPMVDEPPVDDRPPVLLRPPMTDEPPMVDEPPALLLAVVPPLAVTPPLVDCPPESEPPLAAPGDPPVPDPPVPLEEQAASTTEVKMKHKVRIPTALPTYGLMPTLFAHLELRIQRIFQEMPRRTGA
jgi:hypothetical protein